MATPPQPPRRRPKAVRMSDETVTVGSDPTIAAIAEALDEAGDLPPPAKPASGFSWAAAFSAVIGALLSLAIGLWLDALIRELFERAPALGWLAVGLVVLFGLLVAGFLWREIAALVRQTHVDHMRLRAAEAIETDERRRGLAVTDELIALYRARPETAQGRRRLASLREDIIDGAALVRLAETHLLAPLDARGVRLVSDAAKRVSVVTAVSPRAIVDVGYVLFEAVRLVRAISQLYGGRPGVIGFWRLARSVVAHLAVTGGVAMGDAFLQQALGTGLASRISARLGEGVLNGFLTARIGLAALDLCRPVAFSAGARPTLASVTASMLSERDKKA